MAFGQVKNQVSILSERTEFLTSLQFFITPGSASAIKRDLCPLKLIDIAIKNSQRVEGFS